MNLKLIRAITLLGALAVSSGCQFSADKNPDLGKMASFKGPLGLQLYSLREQFAKDVPGTVKLVRDFGFRDVELAGTYGLVPEELRALLAVNHLNAVAGHFSYERFRDDAEGVAKEAKALGLDYAGVAWCRTRVKLRRNGPGKPRRFSIARVKCWPGTASSSSTTITVTNLCPTATARCSICS